MKKILTLMMAFAMVFCMAGYGNTETITIQAENIINTKRNSVTEVTPFPIPSNSRFFLNNYFRRKRDYSNSLMPLCNS